MSAEWKDCSSLQSLAAAEAMGWEIERNIGGEWEQWSGMYWEDEGLYRSRPKQPKTKKVKSLCWRNMATGNCAWGAEQCDLSNEYWQRFPAGDIEGEVPDNE